MKKRIITFLLLLACVFAIGGELLLSAFVVKADAAEETSTTYSNVLDDLKKDSSFDQSLYPDKPGDYSLEVIQVAEGENGELFIYVYQPSANSQSLRAVSINISKVKTLQYVNYKLTFLNENGVFQKYKVDSFVLSSASERYYDISSIFRFPIDSSESDLGNGNIVTEVSVGVGKAFTISDNPDGSQTVFVEDVETIEVTDKYVGFMRYPQYKISGFVGDWDVHFVAFSTDKKIDELLEADIFYTTQSFEQVGSGQKKTYGEKEDQIQHLTFSGTISPAAGGWFDYEYGWNVIEKSNAFISSEETKQIYKQGVFEYSVQSKIDENAKNEILSKNWVLRFAYTEYRHTTGGVQVPYDNYYYTIVGDVSLVRLAFRTNGVYYNLGVVDNKVTNVNGPSNTVETTVNLNDDIVDIFKLILFGVVILVLWRPLEMLFKLLWKFIKFTLTGILVLLSFPFKIIGCFLKIKKE